MSEEIAILSEYIKNELAYDGEISEDMDLLEERILDSFSIVQMAVFIQSRFDIELEASDLVRENLAKISSMIAMINRKRSA
jgi:acyl carrier protein